jgi:hypothetical protein
LIYFPVKGGNVYGKKVVNHYRSCCDCLIIDSGMHYFIDSKPNHDDSSKLSERTIAVGLANSSFTHSRANDATTDSGDSRRNSGATDDATGEPSILHRPVRWKH